MIDLAADGLRSRRRRAAVSRRPDRDGRRLDRAGRDRARHVDTRVEGPDGGDRGSRRRSERRGARTRRRGLRLQQRRLRVARRERSALPGPRPPPTTRRAASSASISPRAGSSACTSPSTASGSAARTTSSSIAWAGSGSPTSARASPATRDHSGLFYARPDGSHLHRAVHPASLVQRRRLVTGRTHRLLQRDGDPEALGVRHRRAGQARAVLLRSAGTRRLYAARTSMARQPGGRGERQRLLGDAVQRRDHDLRARRLVRARRVCRIR